MNTQYIQNRKIAKKIEVIKYEKESNDYWVCFTGFDPIDCNL